MASESLTNTNISETYVGVLHAKGEAIPTTGLQDVYDGFGNKSSLKIGQAGQGIEVDGPFNISGDLGSSFIDALYPIGAIIFSADNTDPGDRFTGTGWTQIAEGRFIAGVGTGNDGTTTHPVPTGNDSTGEYKVALKVAELPAHSHDLPISDANGLDADGYGQGISNNATRAPVNDIISDPAGSGTAHNNIPPSFGLYVWRRITNP